VTRPVDTGSSYRLAVSAEMVFVDLPFEERVRRIADAGFEVEIWDWTKKDIDALARTGATISSMTGYISGTLADSEGADELLRTAEQSLRVAEQLDCPGSTCTAPVSTTGACPSWRPTSQRRRCGSPPRRR
jgi:hydroxypyruvate isomerase